MERITIDYLNRHVLNSDGIVNTSMKEIKERLESALGEDSLMYITSWIRLHAINGRLSIKSRMKFEVYNTEGQLHSFDDEPALITPFGESWYKEGLLHRENDLPADVIPGVSKGWYKEGLLHRENNLPAYVEYDCDNDEEASDEGYYINGVEYTPTNN